MPWVAGVTHTPRTNRTGLHLPLLSCLPLAVSHLPREAKSQLSLPAWAALRHSHVDFLYCWAESQGVGAGNKQLWWPWGLSPELFPSRSRPSCRGSVWHRPRLDRLTPPPPFSSLGVLAYVMVRRARSRGYPCPLLGSAAQLAGLAPTTGVCQCCQ